MRKIKLYTALTIDGFIAREDNSIDFLYAIPNPNNVDHDYYDFYSGIDTLLIGRKTYEEILGFGVDWPYTGKQTYILTSNSKFEISTPDTKLLSNNILQEIAKLKNQSGKDLWLVGGGELFVSLLNAGLVDSLVLSIVPVILGKGIRLFPGAPLETYFKFKKSKEFETGIVNLYYEKVV